MHTYALRNHLKTMAMLTKPVETIPEETKVDVPLP